MKFFFLPSPPLFPSFSFYFLFLFQFYRCSLSGTLELFHQESPQSILQLSDFSSVCENRHFNRRIITKTQQVGGHWRKKNLESVFWELFVKGQWKFFKKSYFDYLIARIVSCAQLGLEYFFVSACLLLRMYPPGPNYPSVTKSPGLEQKTLSPKHFSTFDIFSRQLY